MPFMAAIVKENWDGKWTPYAGVLSMEIYKLKAGSFGVRMLFQGKPVHIPECSDSTCALVTEINLSGFCCRVSS